MSDEVKEALHEAYKEHNRRQIDMLKKTVTETDKVRTH